MKEDKKIVQDKLTAAEKKYIKNANHYKILRADFFGSPRYCVRRGIDTLRNIDDSWMWFDTVEKAREALVSICTFEEVEEGSIRDLRNKKHIDKSNKV